jgi:hypothetical protein
VCRERVEELEPSIRYCLHKIGESNLQASELLQIGEMEGPALDLFKAKLEVSFIISKSKPCMMQIWFLQCLPGSFFGYSQVNKKNESFLEKKKKKTLS